MRGSLKTPPARRRIGIIGSGFTGSLLARILARQGHHVVLYERGRHPRFAIGESTTPLANLILERLARRYDLPDLHALAAHGRWLRSLPEVRRGLKRGFTFYHHPGRRPFRNDAGNRARLLVAASPDDAVADTHWLRADVDHFLFRQAETAGVDCRQATAIERIAIEAGGVRIEARAGGASRTDRFDFVLDASGPARVLARHFGIPSALRRFRTRSALVFGHFRDVPPFEEVAVQEGTPMPAGPYPDFRAAVHHLLPEGWMYLLAFDHGVTSAGFLVAPDGMAGLDPARMASDPAAAWRTLLRRHPSIGHQFAGSAPLFPVGFHPRIQHRLAVATGPRWAALPHTFAFVDPLFSTGIAWGLLAVERLALMFESASGPGRPAPEALARYDRLLQSEADQIDRLVFGGYLSRRDFPLFTANALLYFVTVGFAEVCQRLGLVAEPAWAGFLGAEDPDWSPVVAESVRRLGAAIGTPGRRVEYLAWLQRAIEPRNIGGLGDPARHNMYPVDLEILLKRLRGAS